MWHLLVVVVIAEECCVMLFWGRCDTCKVPYSTTDKSFTKIKVVQNDTQIKKEGDIKKEEINKENKNTNTDEVSAVTDKLSVILTVPPAESKTRLPT